MAIKFKKVFFLFLFFKTTFVFSQTIDTVLPGDTLESIAQRNFYQVQIKYSKNLNQYKQDIKRWNSFISNWRELSTGQRVYVDYPYSPHISNPTWVEALDKSEDADFLNHKSSLNVSYTASFGHYSEKTSEQTIKSEQNFPVTFGLQGSLTNDQREHFLLSSLYVAQSSKGMVKGNSENLNKQFTIPGETGATFYYQYYLKENMLGIYGGYEYEKLNTFNTNEIIEGNEIKNVTNQLHYATLGLSQGYIVSDFKMNLKASFSKSLFSSATSSKPLTGNKFIVFYTYKPEGRFNFSVFYKHHSLKGATDLNIDRFGFSMGYLLF